MKYTILEGLKIFSFLAFLAVCISQIVFVFLKVENIITWDWVIVFIPSMIVGTYMTFLLLAAVVLGVLGK